MTVTPRDRKPGSFSVQNASTPTFASPMALSMPDAVSQTRGGGLPGRGSRLSPLVQMPPREATSKYGSNSRP